MYIPMSSKETMLVKCESDDITLIVKSVTGENEVRLNEIYEASEASKKSQGEDKDSKPKTSPMHFINEIFDFFVVGYILSDGKNEKTMFKDGEKPSALFVSEIKNWLVKNINAIHRLSGEEKKS